VILIICNDFISNIETLPKKKKLGNSIVEKVLVNIISTTEDVPKNSLMMLKNYQIKDFQF